MMKKGVHMMVMIASGDPDFATIMVLHPLLLHSSLVMERVLLFCLHVLLV